MSKSDEERMREVDRERIREIQPNRNKRTEDGRRRYRRSLEHHNLMLASCSCVHPLGKPGGICGLCQGAVLTGEERKNPDGKKLSN